MIRKGFHLFVLLAFVGGMLFNFEQPGVVSAAGGNALQFGPDQYVSFGPAVGTGSGGLGVKTFTVETWFKRTSTGDATTTGDGGILSAIPLVAKGRAEEEGNTTDMNFFLGIETTGNKLAADFEECDPADMPGDCPEGGTPGKNHPVIGSTTIQMDVWYHAAATFDGRYWKLYLNGVEETVSGGDVGYTIYPRWDSAQWASAAVAMNSLGAPLGHFSGVIDEVRIWNKARTQSEILSTMLAEKSSGTGLISRWGFNESSGTTANNSISSGPDGTLVNGPITRVVGFPNRAPDSLDLGNADAYVALGDKADLPSFTIETWLRRDGTGSAIFTGSGGASLIPLITNGTAEVESAESDINYFLGIRMSDGVLCADFEEGAGGLSPGMNHVACGVTSLTNGVWYHAAVTYNGSTLYLYLNGRLERELSVGQPANAANTSQLAFGTAMKTTGETSGYFNGVLDEVRIWDRARSLVEIQGTLNSKIITAQPGLVGNWTFDEGSGTTVSDSSGNNNDGTIQGTGYVWIAGAPFDLQTLLFLYLPALRR